MSRPSTIDRLPREIREKITELRDRGRTIDEIKAKLDELDLAEEVSRSALGRHIKKVDQMVEDMRRARAVADGITRSFGDIETSRVARTNIEMMHALVMKLMMGADDEEPVVLDPKDAMFVATSLEKLSKARKQDFDTELKAAREEERLAAMEQASEVVEKTGREKGLSNETIEVLKKEFLGVDNA